MFPHELSPGGRKEDAESPPAYLRESNKAGEGTMGSKKILVVDREPEITFVVN